MLSPVRALQRLAPRRVSKRSYTAAPATESPSNRAFDDLLPSFHLSHTIAFELSASELRKRVTDDRTLLLIISPSELRARFDYKSIREQADKIKQNVAMRNAGGNVSVEKVIELYESWSTKKQSVDSMRTRRNEIAALMSKSKKRDVKLIAEGKELKEGIAVLEQEANELESALMTEAFKLPNWTHPESPALGESPRVVQLVGERPVFDGYVPKSHMELGKLDDMLFFPTMFGASKFYFGKRDTALLETALVNWAMTTVANKYGFTALTTPDVMAIPFAEACGFQPRSAATQMYSIANSELCLVGTQEIPLASLYSDHIIPEEQLPIKMVAYGHCFRHETGSSSESRGLYRVHQFTKVEMFIICKPEDSEKLHKELLDIEIDLLKDLNLHFKVLDMPADDLGASAYRKFDIEAWMPYREDYGEVTSASNCLDYQSRRLNMRYRPSEAVNGNMAPPQFVHTLNATALAVPRITLAIMENFQQADRSIKVPDALVPFLGGKKFLNVQNGTEKL